ncbi:hypothetical protein OG689_31955 [Kitasatospora sp. NBC_00240]|uniref:hypothetical protein n=1 Tax=Kitasatospora sp. NBC_00240 TaxID=2903567 RepID=UPI002254775D|nr:hypothetical protein [Kitasatospora sp. NBC_00240]MCX5213832.1 hypothetical protein [Kitasatospora sp. NBC_00240]
MRITSRAALFTATAVTSLALVTACGSSGSGSYGSSGSTGASTAQPPAATAPASPGGAGAPAQGAAALQAGTDAKLGAIVTDGAGHTLYRFDKDTAQPSASNCNGGCATTWPPVPAGSDVGVKGIDSKLVGTVTRADGSKQLTLGGWPVYRYAPDTKPGDTKGQGVGGTWFVITPDGKKAGAPAAQPATPAQPPATTPGGYGY